MARNRTHRPTEGELEILKVLWDLGPRTVREVHEALQARKPTGYTTVLKMLQIMTEKGLVQRDETQRAHIYRAQMAEAPVQRQYLRDLLDRVFKGSPALLVMQALSARKTSDAELAEIRQVLDEIEKRRGHHD